MATLRFDAVEGKSRSKDPRTVSSEETQRIREVDTEEELVGLCMFMVLPAVLPAKILKCLTHSSPKRKEGNNNLMRGEEHCC